MKEYGFILLVVLLVIMSITGLIISELKASQSEIVMLNLYKKHPF